MCIGDKFCYKVSFKNVLTVTKVNYDNLAYRQRIIKAQIEPVIKQLAELDKLHKSQLSTKQKPYYINKNITNFDVNIDKDTDFTDNTYEDEYDSTYNSDINNTNDYFTDNELKTSVNEKPLDDKHSKNVVRYVESADELTEDEIHEINSICKRIANKRAGWSGLESSDVASELWIKAIEVINASKSINYRLLYTCLNNRSFDLCRVARKMAENQFTVETVLPYRTVSSITHHEDYNGSLYLQDLIRLFPQRSRERKYITLLAEYIGLGSFLHTQNKFNDLFEGKVRRECELAKMLGFANDTSNGYRSLKQRVKERIVNCELGFYNI